MAIQFFDRHTPRPQRIGFVNTPPEAKVYLAGGIDEVVRVLLHWQGLHSVPCLGDECDLCNSPPFRAAYVPGAIVGQGHDYQQVWIPKIVFISDGALDLLDEEFDGLLVKLNRKGDTKRGKMLFERCGFSRTTTPPSFAVLPLLNSLWSQRSRQNFLAAPGIKGNPQEQPLLPFKKIG